MIKYSVVDMGDETVRSEAAYRGRRQASYR